MDEIKKFRQVLTEAVDESAEILKRSFNTQFKIGRKKDYSDLVTEIDKKSEARIIEIIHKHYPDHNVLSEECGDLNKESDYVWIADPIDGTVNYAHSVPIFCVSLALEIKGEVRLGMVYNPVSGERFYAEKGKGAYLQDRKVKVSEIKELKDSLLVTGFPYGARDNRDHCIDHFNNFIRAGLPIRRLGSAALDMCYIACGRFDGFWEVSLNPWDVAAGYLMVNEAGGKVSSFKGEKYSIYNKQLLATNGRIHDEMIEILQRAYV
jgi:myo-inositol-1(or 4)-monophosphatase